MTTATRPLTSKLPAPVLAVVLFHSPALPAEHLVHAWDALAAAARGEKPEANRAYAVRRLDCLRSEPVSRAVKPRDREAFEVEVAELAEVLA